MENINSYFKLAMFIPIGIAVFISILITPYLKLGNYKIVCKERVQNIYVKGNFFWPTPGVKGISSYFGRRKTPVKGASTFHKGIDILASQGTNVYATASGKVVIAGFSASGGYRVKVEHENNYTSSYCHLSERLYVKNGEYVRSGQKIGTVGPKYLSNGKLNGATTGVHLHFAITHNGEAIDPLKILNIR